MYEPAWKPEASHSQLLPQVATYCDKIKKNATYLIQASIVDVTNCYNATLYEDEESCKAFMQLSNKVTLQAATKMANSKIGKIILLPRPPRADSLSELSNYTNIDLRVQYLKLSPAVRNKLILVNHTIKVPKDEDAIVNIFGNGDRVHFRGPVGNQLYSQSVLKAIQQADVRLKTNLLPTQQEPRYQVIVQNRFNQLLDLNE